MDPVTAIQIAGTALSLVSFGLDTLELYRQIRNNVSGATRANEELEAATNSMKSLMTDLSTSTATGTGASGQLSRTAADSVSSCDELLNLLQDVRGSASSGSRKALLSTYKATMAKRKVEKLREALKAKQDLLKLGLHTDILNLVNKLDAHQQQGHITLSQDLQKVMTQLRTQQTLSSTSAHNIQQMLNKILDQTDAALQAIVTGQQDIQNNVKDLRDDVATGFNQLSTKSAREELLNSLFFPEHTLRRDQLKDAYGDTFSWILNAEESSHEDDLSGEERSHRWDSLPEWLESESELYWISGKLGSGKSTLMAHVLNSQATSTHLQAWTGTRSLHRVSFFFWRPGTPLQRSMEGLLRSLIFQLLEGMPQASDSLWTEYTSSRIPAWTEKRLQSTLEQTLQYMHADGHSACLFIDGLDEFEGRMEDLLQLLFSLKEFKGVKVCVSSRPEPALKRCLASFAHLRLEDLNYSDILEFVSGRLAPCVGDLSIFEVDGLRNRISCRAEGVFLWAVLVTNSVKEGASAGDNKATLHEMIEDTPLDIIDLFRTMLEGTKRVYRKSLAYYAKALKFASEWEAYLTVALFAACKPEVEPARYDIYVEACARMALEIVNRSNGLLAIHNVPGEAHIELKSEPRTRYSAPHGRGCGKACCDIFDGNIPDMHALIQEDSCPSQSLRTSTAKDRLRVLELRKSCADFASARTTRYYDNLSVEWIHRSAHDFFFSGDSEVATNVLNLITDKEVAVSLAEGLMKQLPTLPTIRARANPCLSANIGVTSVCILKMYASLREALTAYLYELDAMIRQCRWCELQATEELHRWSWDELGQTYVFTNSHRNVTEESIRAFELHLLWDQCASYGAFEYLRPHFAEMLKYQAGSEYLSSAILHCVLGLSARDEEHALSHYGYKDRFDVAEEGLRILQQHSADRLPRVLAPAELSANAAELFVRYDGEVEGEDVKDTLGYDQLIWLPPEGLSDALYEVELHTVTNLARTMRSCMALLTENTSRDSMEPSTLETLYSLVSLLSSILNTLSAFFAIPGLKYAHEGWTERGYPILWWDDFEEQSSSIVMLGASASSYLAHTLPPLVPDECNERLQEVLEGSTPQVLAIYRVATAKEHLHEDSFYTIYDSGSHAVVGAVYLLGGILSESVLGGTKAVVNEIAQDLKSRIESSPGEPHGMIKMLYRQAKHPRLA